MKKILDNKQKRQIVSSVGSPRKGTIDFGGQTLGQVVKNNLVNKANSVGTGNVILDYGLGALSTGADLLGNVGLGVLSSFEGIDDLRRNRIADLQDIAGYHKAAEKTRRQAEENWSAPVIGSIGKELQEATEGVHEYSYAGKIPTATAQGIGTSILAMGTAGLGQAGAYALGVRGVSGLNAAGSVVSLGGMGIGSAGSNETQARMELRQQYPELSDEEINKRARNYGLITGTGEVLSEMMFGDISKASNTLGIGTGVFDSFDDAIATKLSANIDNKIIRTLVQSGVKASGEGVEEIVSGLFDVAGKKLALMDERDIWELIQDENLLESFITGTLSAAITQAPGVISNVNNAAKGMYRDYVTGLSENEQTVLDAVVESRSEGKDLTKKELSNLRNEVKEALESGRLTSKEINQSLKEQVQGSPADVYLHNISRNENTQFELTDEELKNLKTENQKRLYQEMDRPNNSVLNHDIFNVVNTVQGINDSVKYHLTTTEGLFQKGMIDKNAKGEYTLNGKKYIPRGVTVDGNNIYINVDTGVKSGTQAMYHEMLEAFKSNSPNEYSQFKQMVKDIVGEEAIQKEVSQYQKMYSTEENVKQENAQELTDSVEDEIINDKFGELAENEDFLSRLTENRTMFQRFIDTVKKFIKYMTGTQEEKNLIKMKDNLEKAFKEKYKGTQFKSTKGTNYSLANDYEFYQKELNDKLEQAKGISEEFYNTIKQQMEEYYERHPLEAKIFKDTKSRPATNKNINSEFFKEHQSDYDGKSGTKTPDGIITSLHLQNGDNLAKLTYTEGQDKIWIDELYVKNQKQGYGSEIVNSIKQYAEENGKTVEAFKELESAKGFWDKTLRNNEKATAKEGNVKYSLTDSQGRELSEQQQEYFKDSKVRDKEGNLLTVYHGTGSEFNEFDRDLAGRHGTYYGAGFYFTPDIDSARDYAKMNNGEQGRVIESYLNMTNPYIPTADTINSDGSVTFAPSFYEDFEQRFKNKLPQYWNDDLTNAQRGKVVRNILEDNGYDGIINGDTYVVFNSNQIKNVDNLNPTSNPDIRYSLTVQEANTGVDNQGRKLTEQQKEYFKDSKVTDENGNLIEVYHGTNHPGFTEFKASQGDSQFGKYKFGDVDVNYFTASQETARGYTDIGVEENGNVYKTYLNITNPYTVQNSSTSEIKSWKNIKDNNIRQYETEYYDNFESKWNREKSITNNLDEINEDLFPFNCELRLNDGYYELYNLGRNDGMGEQFLLYVNENSTTNELFEEGIKENIYGENFDDYIYSSDNIVKWILTQNKNGQNYDGIIIPDILDTGIRGNMFGEPTTDYITFSSNQIKNVDNLNPTSSSDIRYSLSPSGEMVDNSTGEKVNLDVSDTGTTGTLMAIHNLNESKFKGILELGGFPVPSIAVTKVDNVGSNQFGDITVLFDKSTIDPAIRENEVYDRDVWTPTFPTVEYDIDNEMLRKMAKDNNFYDNTDDDIISNARLNYLYADNLAHEVNSYGIENVLDRMKKDNKLKYLYRKTIDSNYQPKMKPTKYSYDYSNETLQKYVDLYNSNKFNDMSLPDFYYHYLNYQDMNLTEDQQKALKLTVRDMIIPEIREEAKNEYEIKLQANPKLKDSLSLEKYVDTITDMTLESFDNNYFKWKDFIKDASRLDEFGETQTIDEARTLADVEGNTNQAEYEKWIEDTFGKTLREAKKGLRNDKDLFTQSGNRRNFNQLHEDYNLQNVVKLMTDKKTVAGEEGFGAGSGFGTLQAQMSHKFTDIDDIRNYANERIVPYTEANDLLKPYQDMIIEDMENLVDYYKYKDEKYNYPMDTVGYALNDFAGYKNQNLANLKKVLNEYQFNTDSIPSELLNKVVEDVNSLKNIPTDYFEAKPQRAVGLDEIQQVVIPNNLDAEFKQQLQDRGIQYTEYDPYVEGDKQRVINQFDDYKFSLVGNDQITPMDVAPYSNTWGKQVEDAIAPLQEQVQQLTDTINELKENIAPISEEEAVNLSRENPNEVAPIRNNLTAEESQELDYLENMSKKFPLRGENLEKMESLRAKELNNPETEISPTRDLNDIRDYDEVGNRNVNAYQYEHPEVKPYFQEEARRMLADLNNSVKAEKFAIGDTRNSTNWDWVGIKRQTSPEIASLLDGDRGYAYSYDDIRKGLNAIIEDQGNENIAVAKRIEFYLDERLRNGYTTVEGYEIAPNQEYNNMLREQEWTNYYEQAPAIKEPTINKPNDLSDLEIDYTPFESMISGLAENKNIREQQAQKVDTKQTNKITKPKNSNGTWNFLKRAIVNEFATVDEFSKTHNAPQIKYLADSWNNTSPIAQSNIENVQTDFNGKEIGRSWNSIWKVAEKNGLTEALNDYLIQWSNLDRQRRGKGTDVSYEQSKKLIEKYDAAYPELKPLAKDTWQYFRNFRHGMRDTGYISAETSNVLGHSDPHYIPFISDGVEGYITDSKEIKPRRTIKRAKGGAEQGMLLPVQEAGKRYTYSVYNTVYGNNLFRSIIKASNDVVQVGGDTRNNYVDMADNMFQDENGYYITAYENGEPITARISEDMYKTLSRQMNNTVKDVEQKLSFVTKPLQKLSRIRRDILTKWSPTFPVKNALKDIQDAGFNSKYTVDFAKEYANPKNLYDLATNKGDAQQFRSLYGGGLEMGMFDVDSGLYSPKKGAKNLNFLKWLENANELIELAPRYAEFKASLKNGATIQEAMYNAREVTTNFSRGGVITKALNRNGFTFLNASVQGFDKFIRNFSGENGAKGIVNSLAKATILGVAPAIFNELVFGWGDDKDEDYDALPDYVKDNYYLIKLENGEFLRIPKGRMLSVFGSAARRTLETAQGEENAFQGYLKNVNNQIGINNPEENNIFAPLIQAFGSENGNAWYGGDIVPTRLQNKPTGEQYDESTDAFSIWLGEKTGISPYKINYVLDQYTGGVGDLVLPMWTEEANSEADNVLEYFASGIKDQFVVDSTYDNKYVSEFYSKRDELTVKANGSKATDEDVLQRKYLDNISSQMTELYKEKREVQSNPVLSKKEKYERATEIKKEINRLAKEGLDNYKSVDKNGDYAEVGDNSYQKTEDGWRKVKGEKTEEMNSLGLNSKEKSQYTKTQTQINEIKEKYKGSSSSADYNNKKTDIINTITTSKLNDEAKVQLYKDNYSDNMVDTYVTDMGMPVDEYLNYKKQVFTADKYANGKSINGSKKQKVFDYINSMNIPYEQKLILAKEQYNNWNDGNVEIINYLNNNKNLDYQTTEDILKHLGFNVDSNGNISW